MNETVDVQEILDNGYAENDDDMMTSEDRAVFKELHTKVDKALECIQSVKIDVADVAKTAERGVEISEQNLRTLRGHNGDDGIITRLAVLEHKLNGKGQEVPTQPLLTKEKNSNNNDDDEKVESGIYEFTGRQAVVIAVALIGTLLGSGVTALITYLVQSAASVP